MKKNLIFYGYHKPWEIMYNKSSVMENLHNIIHGVKIFTDIPTLKQYLANDGKEYKNYILPTTVDHIHELNAGGIKSLFKIDSGWLKRFDDKKLFVEYSAEHNLLKYLPQIYSKESKRSENTLVIVKPKISAFSVGIYKKRLCDLTDSEFENNVVQTYIKDPTEYAGYFVAYNGNITFSFAYMGNHGNGEYIKCENGIYDNTRKTRVLLDKKIVDQLELFLKPTLYTGTCCFDFKIKDGNLKVFELNPRLGGSLTLPENKEDFKTVIQKLMEIYDHRNEYNY